MEEDIKYIVGIDFGHGETTANYIEILDKENKIYSESQQLTIKTGEKKIRSFFCQYRTSETEPWNYDLDPSDTRISNYIRRMITKNWLVQFNHSFKVPIGADPYLETIFGQFVNCVYRNIIECNGIDTKIGLIVNEYLEPQNFLLYAACPSGWSDEQREEFRLFLNKNGVPCEKVFKESDAAWVSYIPQKMDNLDNPRMLVIDYGSSTIDLTWSEDNQKDIFNPNTLGASRVEEDIFNYLINNDETAQEQYEKVAEWIQDDYFVKEIIKLGIRGVKEDFYSQILQYPDDNDIEFNPYLLSNTFGNKIKGLTYFGEEITQNKVFQILEPYIQEVRNYFIKFRKDHMENSCGYTVPKRITLTGGASRMNFVKELVKEVFEVEPIIDEAKASESISSGIALAGVKDFLLHDEIVLPPPPTIDEIKLLVQNTVNTKIQLHVCSLLNTLFDAWQQGKIVMDVTHNLNSELTTIAETMKSLGDTGKNNFDVWWWVKQNVSEGKEFKNGNKSIHALFYAIMDSIKSLNKRRNNALLDEITQDIVDIYNYNIETSIVPSLLNYVKIYAPLTTEDDIKKIITLKLERVDATVEISNEALTQFLTILVKTAYQTIQDKDFSVFDKTLNKDRDYSYRNGYFDELRNDFEVFSKTIETRISNINQVANSISGTIVKKMNEIQNYCTSIRI